MGVRAPRGSLALARAFLRSGTLRRARASQTGGPGPRRPLAYFLRLLPALPGNRAAPVIPLSWRNLLAIALRSFGCTPALTAWINSFFLLSVICTPGATIPSLYLEPI